jgi:capsular polysaccharide biosynthesis protein
MENEKEMEIDLITLWSIFLKNIKPIIAITLFCTISAFIFSFFVVDKKYSASTKVLVQVSYDVENASQELNALSAAQKLVENCKIIFKSDKVITQIEQKLEGQYTRDELNNMISISSGDNTGFIYLTVQSASPEAAAQLANLATKIGTSESEAILKNAFINTIDEARVPENPSSPNVKLNTVIGFVLGLILSYLIFLIIDIIDNKVKGSDDLSSMYGIPLLADIPDLNAKTKGDYRYAKEG